MPEITLEDEIEAVRAIVDRTERFCMRHPRRPDAPPVPDTAERELAAMKAVLARLEASRWRPISEAPTEPIYKDRGPRVLLWWPHWCTDRAVVGWWTRWHGGWRADEALSADGVLPLAWQPLPSPPSTTSEGSEEE